MPRKGVPYGGGICSLKERIAEIWDKLGEKLRSINGVEGDGAGNVEIASGDAAVVINNDQIGHKIKVGLDKSKLPSAAVSSVNGQTGAVALDAGDIPTRGNSNVQADIDVGKADLKNCIVNIIAEREARQNADAALQTNINAAQASIPKMSITPDPYKGIERDAQGRAFAADPAAGATDKTLVTANWLSQTGDSGPNNILHKSGNETKNGKLTIGNELRLYNANWTTIPSIIFVQANLDSTVRPTAYKNLGGGFTIKDSNERVIWKCNAYRDTNGRDVFLIEGTACDGSFGWFHFEVGPDNFRKITTNFDKPNNW